MHTSKMIYQTAVAHQTELRRVAAGRSLKTDRGHGPAPVIRRLRAISSRRAHATPTPQAAASLGVPSISI